MPKQKRHANRVYQVIGEPGPGATVAGYVRYSSELQDVATIVTQKRKIQEYADKKGWTIARWYEEPEQSAKYEEIERRAIFAQLLEDAGRQFAVVLCYMNNRWSRNVPVAYTSLTMSPHVADEVKYKLVDDVVAEYTQLRDAGGTILGRRITDLITVNGVRVALEDGSWVLVRASSNKPEIVVVVESTKSEDDMRALFHQEVKPRLAKRPQVGAYNQEI